VDLDPVVVSDDAGVMKITGKNTSVTFDDVLAGDAWLASGQSNMEFGIETDRRGEKVDLPITETREIHGKRDAALENEGGLLLGKSLEIF
jgi:hypothetical protein